eukprot:TRINITY_DN11709_c1_g1_i2.p1 TRINITY_DN11709_c1_g1~~TRINITY_DN11709_c1_g1_i2.p1  ORF type:complete len:470 (+),score=86.15 TRINITY_DN11709_c1_g1_i2:1666-3075(+)
MADEEVHYSQREAISYYKRLQKALLSSSERKRLQAVLSRFVATKDFNVLATEFPQILDTDSKRSLLPAIKALIPPAYHGQYDKTLAFLGTARWTTINRNEGLDIRRKRVEHEVQQQRKAQIALQQLGQHQAEQASFEEFLARQRELSRMEADDDDLPPLPPTPKSPEAGQSWTLKSADALNFTDADDVTYADVQRAFEQVRLDDIPPAQPSPGRSARPLPARPDDQLPQRGGARPLPARPGAAPPSRGSGSGSGPPLPSRPMAIPNRSISNPARGLSPPQHGSGGSSPRGPIMAAPRTSSAPTFSISPSSASPVIRVAQEEIVEDDSDDLDDYEKPSTPPPLPPRPVSSSGLNEAMAPAPSDKPWHPHLYSEGSISRQDAEMKLREQGWTEGLFLVRAKKPPETYVLSIVHNQQAVHVIMTRPSQHHRFTIDNESYGDCYSPPEMVEALRALGDRFEFELRKPLRYDAD